MARAKVYLYVVEWEDEYSQGTSCYTTDETIAIQAYEKAVGEENDKVALVRYDFSTGTATLGWYMREWNNEEDGEEED